ncbi:unnamed protein product [Danaus chrysippus]|uniref:(African queen) hypothetical protein n=1 Tax=Danaus chrysippus TaxID=151541 RepID=A0A8J2VPU2_9NEOP|nr:unnamed protein product [Danaus chrysippus]
MKPLLYLVSLSTPPLSDKTNSNMEVLHAGHLLTQDDQVLILYRYFPTAIYFPRQPILCCINVHVLDPVGLYVCGNLALKSHLVSSIQKQIYAYVHASLFDCKSFW